MFGIRPASEAAADSRGRAPCRRPRGRRRRPAVEALESRRLLTVAINEFPLSGFPYGIAAGPDGNLWFTEYSGNKIGRSTTSAAIKEFPIPTPDAQPTSIVAGPDGALWFTEMNGDKVGRITTSGAVTEFPLATPGAQPGAIAAGPDGTLWFTEWNANKIGRITTSGAITEFAIPTPSSHPSGIAAGPDGALWFTEGAYPGGAIGRITTAGTITEFPLPSPYDSAWGIAAGPDGNLWFTDSDKIGRITTSGAITEFTIPTPGSRPSGIAAGPDGNMWFTENYGEKIGRITTSGAITEFPLLPPGSPPAVVAPVSIAAGPDGNMWFTERFGAIGQVVLKEPPVATANLGITMSVSPEKATVGRPLTYTLTIYNSGPDTASGVIVSDALPGGVTFASATSSQGAAPTQAGGVVTARLGTMAAGAIATVTVITTVTLENPAEPITSFASVESDVHDPTTANNQVGMSTFAGPAPADLAIVASAAPGPARAGLPLVYTLTVSNKGPEAATMVTATDILPAGVAFGSAVASQGAAPTQAGGVVTARLGTLAAGASATVTIAVVPTAGGVLTNVAKVSAVANDPDPANDAATVSIVVNPPPVLVADLAIAMSTSPAVARAGGPLTYTLTVFNRGPGAAAGVVVADALPAHALVAWASASQGGVPARAGGVLVAHLGDLAPGARATVTLVVLTSAAGALDDVAAVASAAVDPAPADNAVARRITVFPPASSHRPAVGTGAIPPPSGPGGGPAARSVTPTVPAPAAGLAGRFLAPLRPATLPPWSAWGRGSRRAGWWGAPW